MSVLHGKMKQPDVDVSPPAIIISLILGMLLTCTTLISNLMQAFIKVIT